MKIKFLESNKDLDPRILSKDSPYYYQYITEVNPSFNYGYLEFQDDILEISLLEYSKRRILEFRDGGVYSIYKREVNKEYVVKELVQDCHEHLEALLNENVKTEKYLNDYILLKGQIESDDTCIKYAPYAFLNILEDYFFNDLEDENKRSFIVGEIDEFINKFNKESYLINKLIVLKESLTNFKKKPVSKSIIIMTSLDHFNWYRYFYTYHKARFYPYYKDSLPLGSQVYNSIHMFAHRTAKGVSCIGGDRVEFKELTKFLNYKSCELLSLMACATFSGNSNEIEDALGDRCRSTNYVSYSDNNISVQSFLFYVLGYLKASELTSNANLAHEIGKICTLSLSTNIQSQLILHKPQNC